MKHGKPQPFVYTLAQVLQLVGKGANAKQIAGTLRRIETGLSAEDEFSALLSWLGRVKIVHKLDQLNLPRLDIPEYRVPDLFAVFEYHGIEVPVFIEVKSHKGNVLSFRPDYLDGLVRYARLAGFPLLFAWKVAGGIWTLFGVDDLRLAMKNKNISMSTALKQNLMGIVAGDFSLVFMPDFRLEVHAKREKLLGPHHSGSRRKTETWQMKITDAFFATKHGKVEGKPRDDLWALLLCADIAYRSKVLADKVVHSWGVPSSRTGNNMVWSHSCLFRMVSFKHHGQTEWTWRQVVEGDDLSPNGETLLRYAEEGIKAGVVRHVFTLQPNRVPTFLPPTQPAPDPNLGASRAPEATAAG